MVTNKPDDLKEKIDFIYSTLKECRNSTVFPQQYHHHKVCDRMIGISYSYLEEIADLLTNES